MPKEKRESSGSKFYLTADAADEDCRSTFFLKDMHEDSFDSLSLEPVLLENEVEMSRLERVVKFHGTSTGETGNLYCTNFKLSFVTPMTTNGEQNEVGSNKLLSVRDIPLSRVTAIYAETADKMKKLKTKRHKFGHVPHSIHVHTKDFGISTFKFEQASKEKIKQFLTAVMLYVCPKRHEFLYSHRFALNSMSGNDSENGSIDSHSSVQPDWTPKSYTHMSDWDVELTRLNATRFWRISQANDRYRISPSLPEYFPVPKTITDEQVYETTRSFVEYRLPLWCYTHENGCSLVSLPNLRSGTAQEIVTKVESMPSRYMAAIEKTQPPDVRLHEYQLESEICSRSDLQSSYYKLHTACSTDTLDAFLSSDNSFLSHVDSSHWLIYVRSCVKLSRDISMEINLGQRCALLREDSGADFTCVVSSLVQLLLDGYSRTTSGFQNLIQRCWIAAAHPFSDRLALFDESESSSLPQVTPVFLLFLDCVYQLTLQFPAEFEFGEVLLIALWDSCTMGLFKEFNCNNNGMRYPHPESNRVSIEQTQHGAVRRQSSQPVSSSPSVWNWDLQYHPDFVSLFRNPLYEFSLVQLENAELKPSHKFNNVLTPSCHMAQMELWTGCYYRNNRHVQIVNGGRPAEYLQQCILMQEILEMKRLISTIRNSSMSRHSGLLFDNSSVSGGHQVHNLMTSYITSTYPFNNKIQRNPSEISLAVLLKHSAVLTDPTSVDDDDDDP